MVGSFSEVEKKKKKKNNRCLLSAPMRKDTLLEEE
jgi:hypothetical protein